MGVRYTSTRGFQAIRPAVRKYAAETVTAVAAKGQALISRSLRNDRDSAGHKGREFTGAAGQALALKPARHVGTKVVAEVVVRPPADEYWPVIEGGRRPGRPISRAGMRKLKVWARRKLGRASAEGLIRGLSQRVGSRQLAVNARGGRLRRVRRSDRDRALDSLTYLVARKIRREGTPGLHPFRKAAKRLRSGEGRRIARRIALAHRRRSR